MELYTLGFMFFQTTDDRIKKLEKRLDGMEKEMNRTLTSLNDALITVTEVITRMQEEKNFDTESKKEGLKREKDIIISSQKKIESQIKDLSIKKDIKDAIQPVKEILGDNFEFMQSLAKEGFGPSMQDLLRLVDQEGEIRMQDASSRMRVHEIQIEQWANALKEQKLLMVTEKKNRKYLSSMKRK